MSELHAQTTARHWYQVDIVDDEDMVHGSVFWGIVVEDKKRRFQPGHYVCSTLTLILDQPAEGFFKQRTPCTRGAVKVYGCVCISNTSKRSGLATAQKKLK